MASIPANDIEHLLAEIDALERQVDDIGRTQRETMADVDRQTIRNKLKPNGNFDEAAWDKLPEDEQARLLARAENIHETLSGLLGLDGPTDDTHIMYRAYASSKAIVITALIIVSATVALLWATVNNWDAATSRDSMQQRAAASAAIIDFDAKTQAYEEATTAAAEYAATRPTESPPPQSWQKKNDELTQAAEAARGARDAAKAKADEAAAKLVRSLASGTSESRVFLMVVLLGALGGCVHSLASLAKFVGNRQLMRSWIQHYLTVPLVGAVLAPGIYMLLRVGILSPSQAGGAGSAIANINLLAIYAFAFLTGMFAKTATDKLAEVFQTIFRTRDAASKDALEKK